MKKSLGNIPEFFKGKDMLVYAILLTVLTALVFLTSSKLVLSFKAAMETREQIVLMQNSIADWNKTVKKISSEPYRAIQDSQLDDVQKNLLFNLQSNRLELTSFKNLVPANANEKVEKAASGKMFEMSFQGSWSDTVRFLSDFHVKDALISFRDLKISPERDHSVKTVVQYKIYIKGE